MKRVLGITAGVLVIGSTVIGCAQMSSTLDSAMGWTTLIDNGKGLENFNRIGDVNWRAEGDAIVGDKGKGGFLVTKKAFKDFELKVEFWADHTTNSGIYIRAGDPVKITTKNAYEVNIYDQRPGPEYATGAIVDIGKVPVPIIYKAGGKWNTFLITAKGPNLTVEFNGVQTVNVQNSQFPEGPFALQFGSLAKGAPGGAIKWRKLQVKEL